MRRNTFSSFNFRAADTLLELGLCSCYSSNRCKQMYSFNVVCSVFWVHLKSVNSLENLQNSLKFREFISTLCNHTYVTVANDQTREYRIQLVTNKLVEQLSTYLLHFITSAAYISPPFVTPHPSIQGPNCPLFERLSL